MAEQVLHPTKKHVSMLLSVTVLVEGGTEDPATLQDEMWRLVDSSEWLHDHAVALYTLPVGDADLLVRPALMLEVERGSAR